MDGTTPLLRQWQLIVALSARRQGLTLHEMATDHGVNQRTIRRDLNTLQRAGFPLEETVSDHGRKHWKLAAGANSPPLTFGWDEAIALFLARKVISLVHPAL